MAEMRQFLLAQASNRIHAAGSIADALTVLADEAVAIVGAHQGMASLVAETGRTWTIAAVSLSDKYTAWWHEDRLRAGSALYAIACPDQQPIRLTQSELEKHPAWRRFATEQAARPPLRGWLAVPIIAADRRTLGLVQLSDRYDGDFTDQDQAVLVQLAGAAATAVERLRLELGRRGADELFRAAFENAAIGMSMADADGRFLRANAACCRITGYSADELRAMTVDQITHPDDRELDRARYDALLWGRLANFISEKRYVRKDGGTVWVRNSVSAVAAGPSGAKATICLTEDITERIEASHAMAAQKTALEAALARIERIIACSHDIITTVDRDGRFIQIGPRCREIWGYEPAELVGRPVIDLVHPDDREMTLAEATGVIEGRPAAAFVNRYVRKDGGIVHMQWSSFWSEPDGCYFAVARDITERVNADERLRRSAQLEVVGQLTGGIAHDFNNLLMVILGTAELMIERAGTDHDMRSLAETMRLSAERGGELTSRLLAFGRRQSLQPSATDVPGLLESMIATLRRLLGDRIRIELIRLGAPQPAMIDPAQLETAILNLAANARDAMPDGGKLTIAIGNATVTGSGNDDLAPGDYVTLTIVDTGVGMSESVRARAFEPFFTTKDVGKGTGLGLSMVYGFAKQSGGHATIESGIGAGTRVMLYLPVAPLRAAGVTASAAAPAARPGGSERVLVVEDDPMVRIRVEELLTGLGYRVTAVGDGEAALTALAAGEAYDLLFTDIVMPGTMNGAQLAREARRRYPAMRILFTSGYAEDALDAGTGFERGALLLKKPYRRSELAARVREALGGPVAGGADGSGAAKNGTTGNPTPHPA